MDIARRRAVGVMPLQLARRWLVWGSFVVVALIALLPRLVDLGRFVTFDEINFWMDRSETFLGALQRGDGGATAIVPHPGVTTMWLGASGVLLQQALLEQGLIDGSFATRLALLQLPVALVNTAGVLLGYWLLRRLLAGPAALLAAILWAADPFLVSYSRVLHVDALAGTFLALSLLAACCYWYGDRSPGLLVLSSVAAALAVLSKLPAALIAPMVALVAITAPRQSGWPSRLAELLAWGAGACAAALLLWPALLSNPARVLELVRVGVEVEGGSPHATGNFFLGQDNSAPGPLFYPVVLVVRSTPWGLLGLLLLPLAWRRLSPQQQRSVAAVAAMVVLFVVAMTLFPKKFDRYLVPVAPLLSVLAALGLLGLAAEQWRNRGALVLVGALALLAPLNVWYWHPYGMVAANQALGGAPLGRDLLRTGWGEGLEQVAAWLNRQPNITGVITISTRKWPLQPYMRSGAQVVEPGATVPAKAGYAVLYIRDAQTRPWPPFDRIQDRLTPVHTVRIHGVDYAWIYQLPPPVPVPRSATFGDSLQLRGFALSGMAQAQGKQHLTLFWHSTDRLPPNLSLFVHLIGPDGQRYIQLDPPLLADQWQPNGYTQTEVPLVIPVDRPAGTYQITIGVYDAVTGQRLPIGQAAPADPQLDGMDVLLLTQLQLDGSRG